MYVRDFYDFCALALGSFVFGIFATVGFNAVKLIGTLFR